MRKIAFILSVLVLITALPVCCPAQEKIYRIEILQITALEELQKVYKGFMKELERNGFVSGRNLTVKRTVIEFDIKNATFAKEIKVYARIKREASRIAKEKPDLVLTMGTPATKYAKDKIIGAGIPLLFAALAFPVEAGCKSSTESGPGFTGAVTYMDMKDALKLIRTAFPHLETIGIVHSDDSNSIAHVEEAKKEGTALGFTFISKTVKIKDPIIPVLKELHKEGAEAFAVPPDPYYEIQNYEAGNALIEYSKTADIPVISFVIDKFRGAVMTVGVSFEINGVQAGRQAVKILKDEVKPESLPILRQHELIIKLDPKAMKALDIRFPPEILRMAKPVE
jgi:putative tryptophan/tyrosine transport system substrate-binding protein